jgi:hypothetical protein
MTSLISLRPAPVDVIPALVEGMSSADRTEMVALSQGDPCEAIRLALSKSNYSFCWMTDEGRPAAIGGLNFGEDSSAYPVFIWMVASTPRLERSKKAFLEVSRDELRSAQAAADHRKIVSAVDERWRKSIRWLKWLGFKETGSHVTIKARVATILEIGPC